MLCRGRVNNVWTMVMRPRKGENLGRKMWHVNESRDKMKKSSPDRCVLICTHTLITDQKGDCVFQSRTQTLNTLFGCSAVIVLFVLTWKVCKFHPLYQNDIHTPPQAQNMDKCELMHSPG